MINNKNVLIFFEILWFFFAGVALVCVVIDITNASWRALGWLALSFALSAKSENCHLKLRTMRRMWYE